MDTKVFNVRIEVYDGCKEGDIEDAISDALNNIRCDCTFEITEEEE